MAADLTEINDPHTYAVIGAAMEVHRELGSGFLESVYQEALAREFDERDIPYVREQPVMIQFKGVPLESQFRADFVCFEDVLVELKTVQTLDDIHYAQILHYLKATKLRVGVMLNFKSKSLVFKRFLYDAGYMKSKKS